MKEHWDRFHSVEMISQQIRPLLPIQTGLVQGRENRLGLLKMAVTKASHGLAADIILAESNISADQIDPEKDLDENELPENQRGHVLDQISMFRDQAAKREMDRKKQEERMRKQKRKSQVLSKRRGREKETGKSLLVDSQKSKKMFM